MLKDVHLATDPFATKSVLRNDKEAQQSGTTPRPENRIKRRWLVAWALLGLTGSLLLAAPKIVSGSRLGRQLVSRAATMGGVNFDFTLMRIGWNTPLRLADARIRCKSNADRVHVNQIDCDLTLLDLLGWSNRSFGHWVIRGIEIHSTLQDDRFSIENDFAALQQTDRKSGSSSTGRIEFKDIVLKVSDAKTGNTWKVAKSNVDVQVRSEGWETAFSGTFTEPGGRKGSLVGNLSAATPAANEYWDAEFQGSSFPVSVLTLIQRRFSSADSTIPFWDAGSATGTIRLASDRDGMLNAVIDGLEVENLEVVDPTDSTRHWSNGQASLAGQLKFTSDRVAADICAKTDFADIILAGKFPRSTSFFDVHRDPLTWLRSLDGTATVEIDVASWQESFPHVLPLRDEAKLTSGKSTLQIESKPIGPNSRCRVSLQADDLQAVVNDKHVEMEPIELTAIFSLENDELNAERICCNSSFAKLVWQGDLRNGSSELDIDLPRSIAFLSLFEDASPGNLGGSFSGKLQWATEQDSSWIMTGSAHTENFLATSSGARQIRIPQANGKLKLSGRWGDRKLEKLSEATMTVVGSDLNLRAELTSPVDEIGSKTSLPMRIEAKGELQRLAGLLGPWIPETLCATDGRYDAKFEGDFSVASGRLTRATVDLSQPRVTYKGQRLEQRDVNVDFDGQWDWPQGNIDAKSATITCDAFSAAIRGYAGKNAIDLKVAWQANLERASSVGKDRIASDATSNLKRRPAQPAAFVAGQAQVLEDWHFAGDANGILKVTGDGETIDIKTNASATNFVILEPVSEGADVPQVVPIPTQAPAPVPADSSRQPFPAPNRALESPPSGVRVVWSEPKLNLEARVRYDAKTKQAVVDGVQVNGQWLAATLSGHAVWDEKHGDVSLSGPTNVRLRELGQRLTALAGTPVQLEGIHESPLSVRIRQAKNGSIALTVDGSLGWDSGKVAGLKFGAARVPIHMTETSLKITQSAVPLGDGQVRLAGELQYRPGPAVLRVQPGTVAESIQLTEEMTDGWLTYITPLVHRVERIHGVFGVEIDEATVVLGSPEQSRVVGKLNIRHADMSLTPMTRELVRALKSLQSLSKGQTRVPSEELQGQITMPSQVVDFELDSGVVNHKRAEFALDDTRMASSGAVTLDGKLAIIAQLPRDYIAIGKNPVREHDRIITLPVTGSINQPRIDPTGLGSVTTIMAKTARSVRARLSNNSAKRRKIASERRGKILKDTNKFLDDTDKVLDRLQRVLDDSD